VRPPFDQRLRAAEYPGPRCAHAFQLAAVAVPPSAPRTLARPIDQGAQRFGETRNRAGTFEWQGGRLRCHLNVGSAADELAARRAAGCTAAPSPACNATRLPPIFGAFTCGREGGGSTRLGWQESMAVQQLAVWSGRARHNHITCEMPGYTANLQVPSR